MSISNKPGNKVNRLNEERVGLKMKLQKGIILKEFNLANKQEFDAILKTVSGEFGELHRITLKKDTTVFMLIKEIDDEKSKVVGSAIYCSYSELSTEQKVPLCLKSVENGKLFVGYTGGYVYDIYVAEQFKHNKLDEYLLNYLLHSYNKDSDIMINYRGDIFMRLALSTKRIVQTWTTPSEKKTYIPKSFKKKTFFEKLGDLFDPNV
jgi:hypothetical protein